MFKGEDNLKQGALYEEEIVEELNALQLFQKLYRTAEMNKELDAMKVDVAPKDFRDFMYAIQVKSTSSKLPYPKIISDIKEHNSGKIPVVIHKYLDKVSRSERDSYVILNKDDFFEIWKRSLT